VSVYGTTTNPTIAGSKTVDGTRAGCICKQSFRLKGLTKYYVRAYATNSAGTAYGPELSFTTLVSVREWYVPGNYVAASYPGSGLADWSPDKSPMVKSNEANPNNVEGYVYMANASNMFKISAQPNWDGTELRCRNHSRNIVCHGGNIPLPRVTTRSTSMQVLTR
jgi:starch-binding outer membrane protein SusE/F